MLKNLKWANATWVAEDHFQWHARDITVINIVSVRNVQMVVVCDPVYS
jgi:hypothetical protein